jgi:hypothetical protein
VTKKAIETLADLRPDPNNANKGTVRGHSIIEQSVRQRGAGRSGLAAKDGTMIAGSQTLTKMAELGIPIKTVHTTGDEWVVVVRDDIEPGSEDATLLAIEDNRASEVGLAWDPAVFASHAEDGIDMSALFTAEEMNGVLAQAGDELLAQAPEAFPSYGENIDTQYCCPKCSYEWSGKAK